MIKSSILNDDLEANWTYNPQTLQAMEDAALGRNITEYASLADCFKELEIEVEYDNKN